MTHIHLAIQKAGRIEAFQGEFLKHPEMLDKWHRAMLPYGGDVLRPRMSKKQLVQAISSTVCKYYGLPVEKLKEKRRFFYIVRARQIAMYLIRELDPEITLYSIGELFDVDHTTVIHNVNTAKNRIKYEEDYRNEVEHLKTHICQL